MDVVGNQDDANGNSHNHLGQKINVKNYFLTNGELKDDHQRDEEYTKILGERIIDNYHRYNVVLTSHLVCFTVFELLKKKLNVDLFTLLRTPVEDISVPHKDVVESIERLKERLKIMYDKGELLMSPELRWNIDKIIDHGMKNINLYHTASPLTKHSNGDMGTEDLKLLYYYHNRLNGYELEKYV
jgi:glycerol-3-phosphate O-acyltransferase